MIDRRHVLSGLATLAATPAAASPLEGVWTGILKIGVQKLRLRLVAKPDGSALIYSLDQGNVAIEAFVTTRGGDGAVEVKIPAIRGVFLGRLVSPDRLEGVLDQGGKAPLVMLRGEAGLVEKKRVATGAFDANLLATLLSGSELPALAAAGALGARPATAYAVGIRAAGSAVGVTSSDTWHLGSITKPITATLVGRLVDLGLVQWDQTIGEVLGPSSPDLHPAYGSVSFVHLLSHRSGLPGDLPLLRFQHYTRELNDARGERLAWAREALRLAPLGPKQTTFHYSNNGYVVAGAMLEAILGAPWEALMQDRLFKPLSLSSAGFGAPGGVGALNQPVGHSPGAAGAMPVPPGSAVTDNPAAMGPAGRVHMSLPDLVTFLQVHTAAGSFLSPATRARLATPPFGGDYALGWQVLQGERLWHNGSNTFWYAEALVDNSAGRVAAAATNDGRLERARPVVGEALASALFA